MECAARRQLRDEKLQVDVNGARKPSLLSAAQKKAKRRATCAAVATVSQAETEEKAAFDRSSTLVWDKLVELIDGTCVDLGMKLSEASSRLFAQFDRDGNGALSVAELTEGLEALLHKKLGTVMTNHQACISKRARVAASLGLSLSNKIEGLVAQAFFEQRKTTRRT
jgi:hypothetical protein